MPPTKLTEEQIRSAYERWKAGERLAAIAREHHLDRNNLRMLIRRRWGNEIPARRWARTVTLPTDPIELGYLAGIIDGEGNIQEIKGLKGGFNNWAIRVRMADKTVIDHLAQYGGKVYAHKPATENRKPTWEWNVSRKLDVYAIVSAVQPYLKVAEKQDRIRRIIEAT